MTFSAAVVSSRVWSVWQLLSFFVAVRFTGDFELCHSSLHPSMFTQQCHQQILTSILRLSNSLNNLAAAVPIWIMCHHHSSATNTLSIHWSNWLSFTQIKHIQISTIFVRHLYFFLFFKLSYSFSYLIQVVSWHCQLLSLWTVCMWVLILDGYWCSLEDQSVSGNVQLSNTLCSLSYASMILLAQLAPMLIKVSLVLVFSSPLSLFFFVYVSPLLSLQTFPSRRKDSGHTSSSIVCSCWCKKCTTRRSNALVVCFLCSSHFLHNI